MKDFNVIIERDADGYFIASVPELTGCHSQAKSIDAVMKRIQEAIELCLEEYGDKFQPRDFVGIQRVSV